jgi:uncharacterized protein (DUF58 family)
MTSLGGRWSWPAALSMIVLAAGYTSGWHLLQRVGVGLLALLLLCLCVTVVTAAMLTAEGKPRSRSITAGETLVVTYTVRNRGLWPVVWALLRPLGFSTLPVEGQLVALPLRGRRRLDVALPCPQRGRWVAGGSVLHVGDPFGFFERTYSNGGTDIITVFPRPISLPGLQLPPMLGRGISPRGRPSPQSSATVREVRPYQSGDSPSRIHWLSTARHDALMVKEPEGEPAAHVWLVLDLDTAMHYGDLESSSVELLIGAACHIVRDRLPPWVATGLLAVGTETLVKPNSRREQTERLLAALAVVAPGAGDVPQSLRALRATFGTRRSTIIVLTPWADARWSASLPTLARAGANVVCILLDTPDSERGKDLDTQAMALRVCGIQTYRHTAWAV